MQTQAARMDTTDCSKLNTAQRITHLEIEGACVITTCLPPSKAPRRGRSWTTCPPIPPSTNSTMVRHE